MGVPNPEDLFPRLAEALNSGDIEAALALYETDAGFVTTSGDVARGAAELRREFAQGIELKVTSTGEVAKTIIAKDLALVFVRYVMAIPLPDGKVANVEGLSTDVLRRQADGTWLSVIDNPYGISLVAGHTIPPEVVEAAAKGDGQAS